MNIHVRIVDQQGNDMSVCVAGSTTDCGKAAAFFPAGEVRGATTPLNGPPTGNKEVFGLTVVGDSAEAGAALSFQAYSRADGTLYDLSITTAQTLTAGDADTRTITVGQILTYAADKAYGSFSSPIVMTAVAQPTPTPPPPPTTPTPTPTSMPTFPPTPTSGTAPTYTCAAIQAAYKAQQCCTNPGGTFTLPGNRRQVSDRHTDLIEKFAMLDTLVKKGHISAQEYSIYKEKLLETLM